MKCPRLSKIAMEKRWRYDDRSFPGRLESWQINPMSREQDILFCKIAISTGIVSQAQAQKCLALCEKREKEGKRRPMVGALCSKYKLMSPADVQRVYTAVNKRLGASGGRSAGPTTDGKPRSQRGSRRGRRRGSTRRKTTARRKLDRNTLVVGGGFGLVFVAVLVTIVMMYVKSSHRSTPKTANEAVSPTGVVTASVLASEPSAASEGAKALEEKKRKEQAKEQIDAEFARQHRTALQEARAQAEGMIERPDRAVRHLKDFYARYKDEYEYGGDKLKAEVLAEIVRYAEMDEENKRSHVAESPGESAGAQGEDEEAGDVEGEDEEEEGEDDDGGES